MVSEELKKKAKKFGIRLTRKRKNDTRVKKSESELKRKIEVKEKNYKKTGNKCVNPIIAVNKKKVIKGNKCEKGEEKTANRCVKKLDPRSTKSFRWFRSKRVAPDTTITLGCPKKVDS